MASLIYHLCPVTDRPVSTGFVGALVEMTRLGRRLSAAKDAAASTSLPRRRPGYRS